jgi:small RNA 2'-O-methyltransferase
MALHQERLEHVVSALKATGARRILDLGCGSGMLLHRLVSESQFDTVVGVEQSAACLAHARMTLETFLSCENPRLTLIHGSYGDSNKDLTGYDAAAMVETIEHVAPGALSRIEGAVFGEYRPGHILITTPNREYNPLFGLAPGEYREKDHKFEWCRDKFRRWSLGVAGRNGYRVRFGGIGECHPDYGQPTQTAHFSRLD